MLRQFLLGGAVSVINIAIHSLVMAILVRIAQLASAKDTGTMHGFALHALDALALVHALILRLQALVLPFKTLVFSGH